MIWSKYKTIIYTAILTTPFIGLFGITPMIMPIVMQHPDHWQHNFSSPEMRQEFYQQKDNFIPFLAITLQVALIWLQNILLLIYGSRIFKKKSIANIIRFAVSYAITILIIIIIHNTIFYPLHPNDESFNYVMPLLSAFATDTIILIIIQLLLFRSSEAQVRVENAELKMQHIQAQHEKLLHQLHPHFLFNSLNALKTLIRRNTNEAENYLVKLSEFLRFSLTHNEQTVVLLSEELKFSTTYLEMQKTRFHNSFYYETNIPDALASTKKLPVFSLQLLLENCIKHNTFTEEEPLRISINYKDDFLIVRNNLQSRKQTEAPTGVGLANLSERYKYLAGEAIKVEQTDSHFTVYIKLLE